MLDTLLDEALEEMFGEIYADQQEHVAEHEYRGEPFIMNALWRPSPASPEG